MKYSMATDVGRSRKQNQDSAYADGSSHGCFDNLFILADGMGGYKAGDYASQNAIKIIRETVDSSSNQAIDDVMEVAISNANEIIYATANSDPDKDGMGTTILIATVRDEKLYIANVGDSRMYLYREENDVASLTQITNDHTLVAELISQGVLDVSKRDTYPKKNYLTRAVGAESDVETETYQYDTKPGDIYLMCSDGLYNMISEDTIKTIISDDNMLDLKAKQLIDAANEAGGKDNITVILIKMY